MPPPPGSTLFYGENTHALRAELGIWQQDFVKVEGDLNLTLFDGSQTSEEEITTACKTAPFLGASRLVVVRDFNFKKAAPILTDFLKITPDNYSLILTTTKPDARTALFKAIKKYGEIREFATPRPAKFTDWIRTTAIKLKLDLSESAAELLALYTSGDCEAAMRELEKLVAYSDSSEISRVDIEQLVHPDLHTSIFRLTDDIGARNISAALSSLIDLSHRGENLMQIFHMIIRQFRILLSIHAELVRKTPIAAIASTLKLHPFVVRSSIGQTRNFSENELQRAFSDLLSIDTKIKTGKLYYTTTKQAELSLALEKFVISFG